MKSRRSSRARKSLFLATAAMAMVPAVSEAVLTTWSLGGSGNWTTAGNWSAGVPAAGDDIFITHIDAINRTVTYNYAGASINFRRMLLGNDGTGSAIFSQSANTFNTLLESIGASRKGYWVMSGGVHNLNYDPASTLGNDQYLVFGTTAGFGVGTISGGTLNVATSIYLGMDGATGTFNHVGGQVNSEAISVGIGTFGSGHYIQSGGTLIVTNETIGASTFSFLGAAAGVGQATITGGTHVVNNNLVLGMIGAAGTMTVSGGTLNATAIGIGMGLGTFGGGGGILNQTNGSLTAGTILVGAGGIGTFSQSGGTSTINDEFVGLAGSGSLAVSGGSHNPSALYVGGTGSLSSGSVILSGTGVINTFYLTMDNATINQNGGTLSTIGGMELIGASAPGHYNQNAGTHLFGTMILAGNASGGVYSLGSGTLTGDQLDVKSNGVLYMTGGRINAGSLNVHQGGTFYFYGGTNAGHARVLRGAMLIDLGYTGTNSGSITIDSTATAIIDGQLISTGTVTLDNALVTGIGQLSLQAPFGTLRGSGRVSVSSVSNANTIIADTSGLTISGGSLFNSGTIRNQPNASLFIKSFTFNNAGTLIVNAGGGITVDAAFSNSANKTLSLLGGVLATPILTNNQFGTINGFGQITGSVTNNGSIVFMGPTQVVGNLHNTSFGHLSVRNAQTLITGLTTNNGIITTSNGTVIFDGGIAPAPPFSSPLDGGVDGGGSVILNAGGHLISSYLRQSSLSIGGTVGNPGIASIRARDEGGEVSVLDSLTISGGSGAWLGVLDLTDTALIANATSFSNIANYITSAYNGGFWNGHGITSSRADAVHGLGYADNSVLGKSSFEGQDVSPASVLVKYTYYGDANLDGQVDARDLYMLALGWLGSGLWTDGDFNYDGFVNQQDLTLMAKNWQAGNGAPLSQALNDLGLPAAIPEPGGIMALVPAAWLFQRRRRKHSDPGTV